MQTAAQGSLGDNLKVDWMRIPHTTVAVPVTARAANKERSSKGARFHIARAQSIWVLRLSLA
jgi:hypothetical protein